MSISSIRLFVPGPLAAPLDVALSEPQSHYLANVMRAAEGDTLRIFDGLTGEWQAAVTKISRKAVVIQVRECLRPQAAEPDCWLCFALLKRAKTDMAVEKATELGVSVIQPIITARTNADHVNLDRLRSIAIEAAEQCERLVVPEVRAPLPVDKLMAAWPAGRALFVADERRTSALLSTQSGPSALMVGPEGGFTGTELEAIARSPQVTRVSLGSRILRAETAAIAGLTLMLAAQP
jgi:16S rRNA (uracil1498-N3)-methyltransferase